MAATAETIGTWFTAEGFAVAYHSFGDLDAALTVGVALAPDVICIHGGYRNWTPPFYACRKLPDRGTTDPESTG